MIPFFVADRPMSLHLLRGLPLQNYPGVQIGIMAHANTTHNFQTAFHEYPSKQTIKMCDSGIFTREGATLTYEELFNTYQRMGVQYGIMIDVFRNAEATLESAKVALKIYKSFKDSFELVAVAQGETIEDYLDCYKRLKELGFDFIAIGGLLRRRKNTVRFPYVRSQDFMFQVLAQLKGLYPDDWLFALGCFHPSRIQGFEDLNVWGADYKGWIFQYEKRNQTLNNVLASFRSNDLDHLDEALSGHALTLQNILDQRTCLITRQQELFQNLVDGRRTLRAALTSLHEELGKAGSSLTDRFRVLTTRGLLDTGEERLVEEALGVLGKQNTDEAQNTLKNVRQNREFRNQGNDVEARIEHINTELAESVAHLLSQAHRLTDKEIENCNCIVSLIKKTERAHRCDQVRAKIAQDILAKLTPLQS